MNARRFIHHLVGGGEQLIRHIESERLGQRRGA
jgi:hypothetical protein